MFLADEQATANAGAQLASITSAPSVIFLLGNLGAGKTTFTRGFIRSLGYTQVVTSPTYALVESYNLDQFTLHHFDLYRLQTAPAELNFIHEYLTDDAVCIIEWPQESSTLLPDADITLHLTHTNQCRTLSWQANRQYAATIASLYPDSKHDII
jgi:tRNA threonylcarbamoyladenosine biosynthesis protein TsaE